MAVVEYERQAPGGQLAFINDGVGDDRSRCGFFMLGGFMSDMKGTKAEAIAELARATRRHGLRFDYSGHGQSGGLFTDGTISLWLAQSQHMFLTHTAGARILIGSSMGGWLTLLLAKNLLAHEPAAARRIAGLILIAPAADMTMDLMWQRFSPQARLQLEEAGLWLEPSVYGVPYPITKKLIEDGVYHRILHQSLSLPFPIRILQGEQDKDVPVAHALKLFNNLEGSDVTITLIKDGDHRLSSPSQLRLLKETALRLAERADGHLV